MVNAINPVIGGDSPFPTAPFHMQLGSFETGPSIQGPRQTIQRDLFGRYDGSTPYRDYHTLRFGGAIHRISQGDFFAPGNFGPSVTSSNGIDVINAINSDPALPPLVPGDPKGAADNPLNYPVGTITIFNGLGIAAALCIQSLHRRMIPVSNSTRLTRSSFIRISTFSWV